MTGQPQAAPEGVEGTDPEGQANASLAFDDNWYEREMSEHGIICDMDFRCFMATRVPTEDSVNFLNRRRKGKAMSKKRKEEAGKLFRFNKESPEVQRGLLASRKKEWEKYKSFNAAEPISNKEAQELIDQGYKPISMQ